MLTRLADNNYYFPDPNEALTSPNGLLAIGGDLSPKRLIAAYQHGIFPWSSEGEPLLWWSPDPRAVLFPNDIKISHSLQKKLRRKEWKVTFDQCFENVIRHCANVRANTSGTWITEELIQSFCTLHTNGLAHSVEVWEENNLAGGLYGIAIGASFCGESMFSTVTDASKIALVALTKQLAAWHFLFIDCQVSSQHLMSLGAIEIPRQDYLALLKAALNHPMPLGKWRLDVNFAS